MRLNLTTSCRVLVAGVLALAVVACSEDPTPTATPASVIPESTPTEAPPEPLLVVASIYPMQYFAERVGGDRVEVLPLVPPGAEGHTFELTASDLRTIGEADVIAMNGVELEPWLERALESLGDDVSGIVVEAADAEAALEFEDHEAEEGDDHEEEGEHHDEDEEKRRRVSTTTTDEEGRRVSTTTRTRKRRKASTTTRTRKKRRVSTTTRTRKKRKANITTRTRKTMAMRKTATAMATANSTPTSGWTRCAPSPRRSASPER